MRLPVDTTAILFISTGSARPVLDYTTKEPRADKNGQPLFSVEDEDSALIAVRVAGEPVLPKKGLPVRVTELFARPWSMDGRSGMAFQAARVEPLGQAGSGARGER